MAGIKKTIDSRSEFQQGTLTDVIATNEGSLELSFVSTKVDKVETSQADFSAGVLDKVVVTSLGDVQLGPGGSDVTHNANLAEGTLSGAILAAGDVSLPKGTNIAYTEGFNGVFTDTELVDGYMKLQTSGINATYSEDNKAEFETGTLTNVVATFSGDLELSRASETADTITSNADFNTGTLVNAVVADDSFASIHTDTAFEYNDASSTQTLTRTEHTLAYAENLAGGTLTNAVHANGEITLAKETSIFTHAEDFKVGTHVDTTATDELALDGGDLELSFQTLTEVVEDSTQAQFNEGDLVAVAGTPEGDLALSVASFELNDMYDTQGEFNTFTNSSLMASPVGNLLFGQEKRKITALLKSAGTSSSTNEFASKRVRIQNGIKYEINSAVSNPFLKIGTTNFIYNESSTNAFIHGFDIHSVTKEIYCVYSNPSNTQVTVYKQPTSGTVLEKVRNIILPTVVENERLGGTSFIAIDSVRNEMWVHGLTYNATTGASIRYVLYVFDLEGKFLRNVEFSNFQESDVFSVYDGIMYEKAIYDGNGQEISPLGLQWSEGVLVNFDVHFASVYADATTGEKTMWAYVRQQQGKDLNNNNIYSYKHVYHTFSEGVVANNSLTGRAIKYIPVSDYTHITGSNISWAATLDGSTVTVNTSLDGGNSWQSATNGSPIPNLNLGDDLTGKYLGVRVYMSRPSTTKQPSLTDLNIFLRSSEPSISIDHTEDFLTGVVVDAVATTGNVELELTPGSVTTHTEDLTTGTKTSTQIVNGILQLNATQSEATTYPLSSSYTFTNSDPVRGGILRNGKLYYVSYTASTTQVLSQPQGGGAVTTEKTIGLGALEGFAMDTTGENFWLASAGKIYKYSLAGSATALYNFNVIASGGKDLDYNGTHLIYFRGGYNYFYTEAGVEAHRFTMPTVVISGQTNTYSYYNNMAHFDGHLYSILSYFTVPNKYEHYLIKNALNYTNNTLTNVWVRPIPEMDNTSSDYQRAFDLTITNGTLYVVSAVEKKIKAYLLATNNVAPSGTYVSNPVAINNVTQVSSSSISWTQTVPTNTNLVVEVSTDNGSSWTPVTSGGPVVPAQTDLTGKNVQVRATLSNTNNTSTPTLTGLSFQITQADMYASSGTYVSDPIPMGEMEDVTSSTMNWTETKPANTNIVMEASLDGGATWSEVLNGGEIVPAKTNIVGKTIIFRATLSSTNGSATPQLTNVDVNFQSDPKFAPSGSRIRYIDLEDVNSATLSYNATLPTGTSIVIETSIDGGAWTTVTSGSAIPGLTDNMYGQLAIRQTLQTNEAYTSPLLHDLTVSMSKTQFLASGSHTSNVITIPTHLVSDARINWTQTTPTGTSVEIQTSTDGGTTFTTVANGGLIPGFTINANAPASLVIKQILYTSDTEATPSLHDLNITVNEYFYKSSGGRVAIAKDLSTIKIVESSTLSVATTLPEGTNIVVETSTDNVNWTPRISSLGLIAGTDVSGVMLYVRQTLTTTNPYVTPILRNVSYQVAGYSYETEKDYVASNFVLSNKGVVNEGIVSWTEDKPAGTDVAVSLVLPSGAKVAVTNGQPIVALAGLLAESAIMHFEATLSTSNIAVTPSLSAINLTGSGKRYDRTATHTTAAKIIDIASVASSELAWSATGVVTVHTSLDNGATWQVATNGSAIPGITKGSDLTGVSILVRTTITGAITSTPKLHDISWSVSGGYLTSGSRTIAPIDLSGVGIARSSSFTFSKTEPLGTSAKVEVRVSTNGGTTYGEWVEPVNGQSIPGIVSGMSLANVFVEMRQTLLSTDVMVTPSLHAVGLTVESGFKTAGTYESNVLSIEAAELVATSLMTFAKTTPVGTSVIVESRLSNDNGSTFGAWQVANTAQAIPSIAAGIDVTGKAMQLRYSLATTDVSVSPSLHGLSLDITAGYKTGGTYHSVVVDKSLVGVAASSQLSWIAVTPLGTSVKVDVSLDGGATWQIATNGQSIPNVNNGTTIQMRATLATTDLTQTPKLDSLWFTISSGFATKGTRTSFAYLFPGVGKVSTSRIRWTATTPIGTSVVVETSVDNGLTWQIATNGYIIPGITGGMQMENKSVIVRQTLNTNQTGATPVLHDLTLTVEGGGYKQVGHRLAAPIALEAVGTIFGNQVTWISTEPLGTSVEILAAISPNSTMAPPDEVFQPLLITSRIEMGIDRYETTASVEQIVEDTEMSGLYLWIKEILSTEDVN